MSPIGRSDAQSLLDDIETITRRVRQSQFYQRAALILIFWGCVTAAAYVVTFVWPQIALRLWTFVNVAGNIGTIAIAISWQGPDKRGFDWRVFAAFFLFLGFGYVWSMGIGHFGPRELSAFWPAYFMLAYSIAGLWLGPAFVAIGLGVSAATFIGYFWIGPLFDLWMAIVNGGGLILGGLWMRRA